MKCNNLNQTSCEISTTTCKMINTATVHFYHPPKYWGPFTPPHGSRMPSLNKIMNGAFKGLPSLYEPTAEDVSLLTRILRSSWLFSGERRSIWWKMSSSGWDSANRRSSHSLSVNSSTKRSSWWTPTFSATTQLEYRQLSSKTRNKNLYMLLTCENIIILHSYNVTSSTWSLAEPNICLQHRCAWWTDSFSSSREQKLNNPYFNTENNVVQKCEKLGDFSCFQLLLTHTCWTVLSPVSSPSVELEVKKVKRTQNSQTFMLTDGQSMYFTGEAVYFQNDPELVEK